MHVDAAVRPLPRFCRANEQGRPMASPPLIWDIETDPVLANVKLIAEAWDAGGLYEVGSFVGDAWKEWNGKFRDDVRSFLKSDNGRCARWPVGSLEVPISTPGRGLNRSRA
jgi:glycogen operon protein